jgi:ATP-dependent Clp protease protease subunit
MTEKNELSDIISYGIDFKNRRIYFGVNLDTADEDPSAFTPASVEYAIRAIHKMASDSPNKPIEIHMSSFGGDPYSMLRLHDEILACPCQVRFIGGGAIMSAATWIMAVCDERVLHSNTTIMVHDGSEEFGGKHTDTQITAAEMKRLQDLLYDIYAANSRMPKSFWEDVCQRDLYLNAKEAVTLGLADKILDSKKRGNLRKSRQAALRAKVNNNEMKKLVTSIYGRINKLKVPKIELNLPVKEPVDPALFIEEKIETAAPSKSAAVTSDLINLSDASRTTAVLPNAESA